MNSNRARSVAVLLLEYFCFLAPSMLGQEAAGLPDKILVARTAYFMAVATNQQPQTRSPIVETGAVKPVAQADLAKAIRKWGRFEIVDDVSEADLVLLVVEWEDHHRWGNSVVCRDQLFVFDGGSVPGEKSTPLWKGDPDKWGKFGGCSGAGEPVKELRQLVDQETKASR
jgi:hypothetical protein